MKALRALVIGASVAIGFSCGGSTAGGLVSLPFSVGGRADGVAFVDGGVQPLVFTNPLGWTVTLQNAYTYVGPIYLNADPFPADTYYWGTFLLQSTEQELVNTLDPRLVPIDAGADGITGTAVAAQIDLFAPDQTQDPEAINPYWLDNESAYLAQQAYVTGVATNPCYVLGNAYYDLTVHFDGFIQIDYALDNSMDPLIWQQRSTCSLCPNLPPDGGACPLDITESPQQLVLRVDPTHWFDGADFSDLVPEQMLAPDGGGVEVNGGMALCPPLPDAGTLPVYALSYTPPVAWTDSSEFNLALASGLESSNNVYAFSLAPLDGGI